MDARVCARGLISEAIDMATNIVRITWPNGDGAEYSGPLTWFVAGIWRALAFVSGGVVT